MKITQHTSKPSKHNSNVHVYVYTRLQWNLYNKGPLEKGTTSLQRTLSISLIVSMYLQRGYK